jgi:hypothetical protein
LQAFSSVNIEDSRRMKNLAEVSVRDSAGMSSCNIYIKYSD